MKYGDFPTQETITKLSSYAFQRESVDESVFKVYSATKNIYDFINNQKVKILERVAIVEESGAYKFESDSAFDNYKSEMLALLKKESEFEVPILNITEDDFLSDNCARPKQKELWLNAIEKESIIRFASLSSEVIDR